MSKLTLYKQILVTLEKLHKAHPTYNMGKHISTALDGSDIWGVSDKELLISLKKYEANLEIDINHADDEDIENIIKDGMNLGGIFSNDVEEEEEY
jgi:hypothetical protein